MPTTAKRTEMDRLRELVRLYRMGEGCREVCRLLKMSPKTELKYRSALTSAGFLQGPVDELPEPEEIKAAMALAMPPPPPIPWSRRTRKAGA